MRRPSGPRMRSMRARTCSSLSKDTSEGIRRPSRSTNTLRDPLTMISVTDSSRMRASRGPSPNTVSMRPSTSPRNTAASRSRQGSRVASRRQAARISLRARSGLSPTMTATRSRGTISPTAARRASMLRAARPSSSRRWASSIDWTLSRNAMGSPPIASRLRRPPERPRRAGGKHGPSASAAARGPGTWPDRNGP